MALSSCRSLPGGDHSDVILVAGNAVETFAKFAAMDVQILKPQERFPGWATVLDAAGQLPVQGS